MTNAKMIGMAVGIMVGLIICVVIFKFFNKDGKATTKYDEMQERVRGKAYKYAFWTIALCEVIFMLLIAGDVSLPFNSYVVHFMTIVIGILVQVVYCIWNGAYFGLNTNHVRFAVVSIIISVINFVSAFASIVHGEMYRDGKLQDPFMNLLCAVMFIIVGIVLLVRNVFDRTAKED